jgi:hypothetical protein
LFSHFKSSICFAKLRTCFFAFHLQATPQVELLTYFH